MGLMGTGMLVANAVPLSRFAKILSPQLDHLVIDRTSLTGRFDIQVRWTPDTSDSLDRSSRATPASSFDAPAIYSAIQEQLGLKLVPAKGPVEVLVIDHPERPTTN
jgi:uncharacterized protein (TIGR03435 family)